MLWLIWQNRPFRASPAPSTRSKILGGTAAHIWSACKIPLQQFEQVTLRPANNQSVSCTLQPLSGKFYQFYSSKVRAYSLQVNWAAKNSDLLIFKLIFLGAVVVFELGSLLCALSKSSAMFIIGRAVAGCGGAGVLNGAFTIIAAAAPLDRRPSVLLSSHP